MVQLSFFLTRSYKWFFILIGVVFATQLFLAYKSFRLSSSHSITTNQLESRRHRGDAAAVDAVLSKQHSVGSVNEDDEDLLPPPPADGKSRVAPLGPNRSQTFDWGVLNFEPSCDLRDSKEIVSAVQRARSDDCKKHIIDVGCAIRRGTFYPTWLPHSCPSADHKPNRYLGCYMDNQDDRLLARFFIVHKATNTPKKCIQTCLQSGFSYAGTQYSNECFCGNDSPPDHARLPDASCSMKCSGDPSLTCGGFYTIAIYETGVAKFAPQQAKTEGTLEQKPVKIAFLLTLNGRAVRQVYRLLKALYRTEHFFYIHIDSRQRYIYRELLALENRFSNIKLAKQRFSTIWGGASLLKMLLASMGELLASPWQWDYIVNLSESDFPVKTVDKLARFLTLNRGMNFVKSHGRETQRFIQKQGLDKTFVECDYHMWRLGERELPDNVQIDGGSDWLGLSREFVQYVAGQDRDDLVRGLLIIFGQTLLPAESFFHTVLRNSRFCHTYIDNNLHITNWRRKQGCKCQYKHVVDWCGCSPNDFKPEDWSRLEATETKAIFFARKFEPVINHAVIIQLEEWIYGPYPDHFQNLRSYWQNVYHHFDDTDDRDGILSTALSLLRLNTFKLPYQPGAVLEVTNYFDNDAYKGFLVLHEGTTTTGDVIELEMWVRPNQTGQVSKSAALGKRIQLLEVTTDFDQKEQVSRNFAKTLGPNSEPHLALKLAGNRGDHAYNLTILWYQPNDELADVSEMFIEDASVTSTNYVKANLRSPLTPGVWLVKVLHKRQLIGLVKFFIIAPFNNNHPSLGYNKNTTNHAKDRTNRTAASGSDSNEIKKLDKLTSVFFVTRDICIVNNRNAINQLPLAEFNHIIDCSKTKWSSKAPDPKSDINQLLNNT